MFVYFEFFAGEGHQVGDAEEHEDYTEKGETGGLGLEVTDVGLRET